MKRTANRLQAGFTLMDVLVAILLLVIGITGLLAMQLTTVNANIRARQVLEASQLAQDLVEQFRILPPTAFPPSPAWPGVQIDARGCLVAGDTRAFCNPPLPGHRYFRFWRSAPIYAGGPVRFEVTVSWWTTDGPRSQPNQLHSVTVADVR